MSRPRRYQKLSWGAIETGDVLDPGTTRKASGPEPIAAPIVAEVAVAPSRLDAVLEGEDDWRALMGVGTAWVGLGDGEQLDSLRGTSPTQAASHR